MPIHSAVIQKLLSTNAHIGRRITSHHLKPYLHGTRNSLSIIDSDKTLVSLRSALDFIGILARTRYQQYTRPARFLFVNTNPLYDDIFDHMTRLTGFGSFLSPQAQYWRLGGFLTNPHSPKKFRSRNKKLRFAPVDPPDCVIVVDPEMKSSVLNEAARIGVPVIALVDSKTPLESYKKIAYPIVCGGDSVQFVYMVCNLITKTFLLEQKLHSTSSSEEDPAVAGPLEILAHENDNGSVAAAGGGSPDGIVANSSTDDSESSEDDEDSVANVDVSREQAMLNDTEFVPHSA